MSESTPMDILEADIAAYLRRLNDRSDEPVLLEMEAVAEEAGFPIVGRVVGACLELLTRAIGAKRVIELGSGFGFSGYWFARAVGETGEVVLTDGDPDNEAKAKDYLSRAELWDRCSFMVGDALTSMASLDGEFDIVYCDIDKGDYPEAFAAAAERLRPGGMYICDNVLWSGRVARDDSDDWTEAIRRHNETITEDRRFLSSIIPIRDGVMVALKL